MRSDKWDKKLNVLRSKYPQITNINWGEILRDEPEVFCGVVGKVTVPDNTKKSEIQTFQGNVQFARVSNSDYSELEFKKAFTIIYSRYHDPLIEKTNLSERHLIALMEGSITPTYEDMEEIAQAIGRNPSFFMEYRIAKILASIDSYLMVSPETTSVWYNKVSKNESL